jgi:putative protease
MKNKYELPELLAPAGDFEALRAAVAAGADAVYIGGKRFGARAYAKNFEIDEIKRAVIFCHIRGVRLYVTVNTLIYEREMADAVAYARELHLAGVDALIVADIGLCKRLKEEIPSLELHASTQMGIHNTAGADFAYSLGVRFIFFLKA